MVSDMSDALIMTKDLEVLILVLMEYGLGRKARITLNEEYERS